MNDADSPIGDPGDPPVDPRAGSHYDTSNDFYRLWLDRSLTYSCAYFARGDETLEQAQAAKWDLIFGKLGLKRGHRLLDVGCGWGAAIIRAAERFGAEAVGLTPSEAQFELATARTAAVPGATVHREPWERYHGTTDRIIAIESLEHFTSAKYPAFFRRCVESLGADGMMLVQTITVGRPSRSFALLRYAFFLHSELFFEAELPRPEEIVNIARMAGLELVHAESLRPHYARTIEMWIANLESDREAAIAVTDAETYARYLRYLEGAARYHRSGETNLYQFVFGVA
jgi:cyclopropane-fatty-acyl-phospholipid synthase